MIEAAGLTKEFGTFTAVNRVSLRVAEGEVLALLGPNGAGKTTTVRMLAAILQPSRGSARVAGYDTVREAGQVRGRVGLLTEFSGLYPRMTGLEHLNFFGQLHGLPTGPTRRRSLELLERFELVEAGARPVSTYSKGMKQKLGLARAMLHDPWVLFLDEPTSAMDPHSARLVRQTIAGLRQERRTVVVCTHNLAEAEQLADRMALIRRGRFVAAGTPVELKRELLGDPVMELRLAAPVGNLASSIVPPAELIACGPDWLRYRVAIPAAYNPALLSQLARAGIPVLTLSEVPRSLEEVYLRIMRETKEEEC